MEGDHEPGGPFERFNRVSGLKGTPASPEVGNAMASDAVNEQKRQEELADLRKVPTSRSNIHTGTGVGKTGYMGNKSLDERGTSTSY